MQLIQLSLLTVFVGVTLGKHSECLRKEIPACMVNLDITKMIKEADLCKRMRTIVACVDSASRSCNGEGQEMVMKVEEHTREMCREGSGMHQDAQNLNSCLANPSTSLNFIRNCIAKHADVFMELARSNLQEHPDKMMKIVCPIREKLANCQSNEIKAECGEHLGEFVRKFQGPYDEIMKDACDSASIASISVALIFLQLLVAIFSFRKSL